MALGLVVEIPWQASPRLPPMQVPPVPRHATCSLFLSVHDCQGHSPKAIEEDIWSGARLDVAVRDISSMEILTCSGKVNNCYQNWKLGSIKRMIFCMTRKHHELPSAMPCHDVETWHAADVMLRQTDRAS